MALTRSMLKGMGLTEEQVGAIIEEHTNVTNALKSERDQYKADAEKYQATKAELDALKSGENDWEDKYNREHQAFEDYKKTVAQEAEKAKLTTAYRQLLLDSKVGESHISSILKITDFSNMKLDADGKLQNSDKLVEQIKEDWGGFITTERTNGTHVEDPPKSQNSMTQEAFNSMPLAERMAYANAHPAEAAQFIK